MMKFAFCNEMLSPDNWLEQARFGVEMGYSGLEVAPFTLNGQPAPNISRKERDEFRMQVESTGLEIIGLHWLLAKTNGYHLTSSDSRTQEATSKYLGELATLCADLGGQVMVLGSPQQRNFEPPMTHEQAVENAAKVIHGAIGALEERHVSLAIEPLGPQEGNFLNTAEQAVNLIELIGHPSVGLHLDVKAMSSEESSIPDLIRHHAHRTLHFHANDPNLLGPGMGEVDFSPIMSQLRASGYDRWVSVEVFDYAPGVQQILRDSIQCMRQALL